MQKERRNIFQRKQFNTDNKQIIKVSNMSWDCRCESGVVRIYSQEGTIWFPLKFL